jgi:hypothetical protein
VKEPAKLSLIAAMVLVAGVVAALTVKDATATAPVRPEAAGITGQVWVMPAKAVRGFLSEHHVESEYLPVGTTVVGRVSWSARAGSPEDEHYTIMLGDENGGAGEIHEVVGLSQDQVGLGNGSEWNDTVDSVDWLRGDRAIKVPGGYTQYGTFAFVRTDVAQDVWFLGEVTDVSGVAAGGQPTRDNLPRPVLGVALSTQDRVWWLKRVASAHVS